MAESTISEATLDRLRERARFESWMDSLSLDERAVADRLMQLPGGNHAGAWLAVEITKNRNETCRTMNEFRQMLAEIKGNTEKGKSGLSYATIGAGVVAIIAFAGKMLGIA